MPYNTLAEWLLPLLLLLLPLPLALPLPALRSSAQPAAPAAAPATNGSQLALLLRSREPARCQLPLLRGGCNPVLPLAALLAACGPRPAKQPACCASRDMEGGWLPPLPAPGAAWGATIAERMGDPNGSGSAAELAVLSSWDALLLLLHSPPSRRRDALLGTDCCCWGC